MDVITEFFRTLPAAGQALWIFADGLYGLLITVASAVLFAALAFAAITWRDTHSWLSATFGTMAGFVAFWWGFGIIPSATTYFLDANRDLLAGAVLPESLPGMDNAYQVLRDIIVTTETALAVIVFCLAAAAVQRRYPRTLAEGEERGPTSGGYK